MKKIIWSGVLPVVVTGLIGGGMMNAPNPEKSVPEITKSNGSETKSQFAAAKKKAKKKGKKKVTTKFRQELELAMSKAEKNLSV